MYASILKTKMTIFYHVFFISFTVDLLLECRTIATGTGTTKKEAERQASIIAVNKLELSSGFTSHNQVKLQNRHNLYIYTQEKSSHFDRPNFKSFPECIIF